MGRRIEVSNYVFNAIRKKKREVIQKKIKDKRMSRQRVTDAYILDMMVRENGKR